ncbi:MAG: hypothetical protein N3G80_01700 [Candidatus Micrarchaeota archaeon]|nr:hypothetical protein [Candidatus Micrarchaeota archaeon]
MKMTKGQISTEILVLIGILLLLLAPVMIYAFMRSNSAKEEFAIQKAEFAANRLARLADSVGYLGGSTAIVERVEIPAYVKAVKIAGGGHDIVIEMDSSAGKKEIVQTTVFKIKAVGFEKISKEGTYLVEIRALSDFGGTEQVEMAVK